MTAGQGPGPYGDPVEQGGAEGQPDPQGTGAPQGQPPYGQPPQGQPPYGQPPYGQSPYGQPPYGQPPYGQPPQYGWYGAAPSATFGYGVPAPVERPLTVRAAIGAFVGSIVLSVVAQVITFLNWDTVEDFVLGGTADFSQEEAEVFAGMTDAFGTIGLVIGALFTALFALFVWFAWKGHNWARVVLWILAGLGVILAPLGWAAGTSPLPVLDALAGFELVLDVVAIVLLALKPSNEWYRYRGWLRATGQPG